MMLVDIGCADDGEELGGVLMKFPGHDDLLESSWSL
jgi:hypothetical protein